MCVAAALLPLFATRAAAQGLKWSRQVEAAVQHAQRTDRPLMFYLVDRSRRTNDELRRRQAAVFRDPRVAEAARKFVCVELPIDQHPELAQRWNLPARSSRYVVYATPSGEKIHQSGVGAVDDFRRHIRIAYHNYTRHVWENELLDVFRADPPNAAALLAAVRRAGELKIIEADVYVARLVELRSASDALRGAAFETLARLSTKLAIETLVQHAPADERAARALADCDAAGAERMLPFLEHENARVRLLVYDAVTRICRVPKPKNAKFWKNADARAKADELRRVRIWCAKRRCASSSKRVISAPPRSREIARRQRLKQPANRLQIVRAEKSPPAMPKRAAQPACRGFGSATGRRTDGSPTDGRAACGRTPGRAIHADRVVALRRGRSRRRYASPP
ncbi:MAG: hypothetical protein D6744_09220 [Planctomycetota bacterium]|nr:MAG: hypothetical protein D6744_09220 [Planctomycetota bacterium]